jgi:hypothetical protein
MAHPFSGIDTDFLVTVYSTTASISPGCGASQPVHDACPRSRSRAPHFYHAAIP